MMLCFLRRANISITRMIRKTMRPTLIIILLFLTVPILSLQHATANASNGLKIEYLLALEKEDFPVITMGVKNAAQSPARFAFWTYGSSLGAIEDLQSVFTDFRIEASDGKSLDWNWEAGNQIVIDNGEFSSFEIKYTVNGLGIGRRPGLSGIGSSQEKWVLFRSKRIFFVAGDVFLLPQTEPRSISVKFSLPEGTEMFSSLPEQDGEFAATKDLWGNILYDFQKAYFTGGEPVFHISHVTEWGDEYIYIYFDRDPADQAQDPSSGMTAWEYAEEYMKTAEMFAQYLRETVMGSLPRHTVLFSNVISFVPFVQVKTNTDWFHYMQIWPIYSEPEVAHHLFHQYSFFVSQSKLPFNEFSAIGSLLTEGLPTYFEQVIPSELFSNNRYQGKLFEFYVLDSRGERFNIRENSYHNRYNLSALKVYLLDQHIRSKTNNDKSIVDFTKELWDRVKDNGEPQEVPEETVINAFAAIVGENNQAYLSRLTEEDSLDEEYFISLLPSFFSYMDWMTNEYFWGNRLLFLSYLDIVSAKDGDWPHGATYPHNVLRYRRDALVPFREYLVNLNKITFNESDIVNAMGKVTGKDHAGFFEFWESLGISLDPNSILPLSEWNPKEVDESEFLPRGWNSVGTLRQEHYLCGVPQEVTAILDEPDDDGQIVVEVRLHGFKGYPPENEASKVLGGQDVSIISSRQYEYENVYSTSAFFKVTIDDADRRVFTFNLTLPSPSFYPTFHVLNYPLDSGSYTGELYWLHSIDPVDIDITLTGGGVILPDTTLDGETYVLELPEEEIRSEPDKIIDIPVHIKSLEVSLFDKHGFLRARRVLDLSPSTPQPTTAPPSGLLEPPQATEAVQEPVTGPPSGSMEPSETTRESSAGLGETAVMPWIILGASAVVIAGIIVAMRLRRR